MRPPAIDARSITNKAVGKSSSLAKNAYISSNDWTQQLLDVTQSLVPSTVQCIWLHLKSASIVTSNWTTWLFGLADRHLIPKCAAFGRKTQDCRRAVCGGGGLHHVRARSVRSERPASDASRRSRQCQPARNALGHHRRMAAFRDLHLRGRDALDLRPRIPGAATRGDKDARLALSPNPVA